MTRSSASAAAFEHVMQGLALVDYDNMRGYRRKSKADFERHAADLIDMLAHAFRTEFPDLRELDVRFYGGWTDEWGFPSRDAVWLLQALSPLRGRRHGLIVRPSLATALLQFPELVLIGTVRLESGRCRQKMVDAMLGCDATFVATEGLARIGIITDDDDLVPATLSAHAANATLTVWMRPRPVGEGLNDSRLVERGLRIRRLEAHIHA